MTMIRRGPDLEGKALGLDPIRLGWIEVEAAGFPSETVARGGAARGQGRSQDEEVCPDASKPAASTKLKCSRHTNIACEEICFDTNRRLAWRFGKLALRTDCIR